MSKKRTINVTIEHSGDDWTHVSSADLPGLILAGRDRIRILAAIEPAARTILERKGEDTSNVVISATFVAVPQPSAVARAEQERGA